MKIPTTLLTGILALTLLPAFAGDAPHKEKASPLHAYLKVQKSLAGDNLVDAKRAAGHLAENMEGEESEALAEAAKRIAGAEDIATARKAFHELSTAMIARVKTAKAKPHAPLYRVHCPMAFGGGADWLQADQNVANPYYGSRMARCGAVKERIGGVNAHDAPAHGSMHGDKSGDGHGHHH